MNETIPMAQPDLTGNEIKYVTQCVKTNWISSKGEFVLKFEEQFSKFCDTKYGVAVSNGTTALHLALLALGIKEGDEVIVPDLTFAATANAVLYCGAKPVLVDVTKDTWCIDPEKIAAAITPQTKAIIPVHLYGSVCNMDAIMKLAKEHDLFIVEDCAEAHGIEYNGKKVGSFGDVSCFSFFGNKIITTGEGGMCITNNKQLADKMRVLRDHGMTKERRYWHDIIGYNYRITNIQAAIGVAQLERIDEFIQKRKEIATEYTKHLSSVNGISLPPLTMGANTFYWMYSITLEDRYGTTQEELMAQLKDAGIESRPFFHPLHHMPPYALKDGDSSLPVSTELSKKGISLPYFTQLTHDQIRMICEIIKSNQK